MTPTSIAVMARTRKRPTALGVIDPADALAFGITLSIISIVVMGLGGELGLGIIACADHRLLCLHLHPVAEAQDAAEHRDWRRCRCFATHGRLGGGHRRCQPDADRTVRHHLLWTPPHFWALALYRAQDYAAAGVPMLPVTAGAAVTRRHILAYTLVLLPISWLPLVLGACRIALRDHCDCPWRRLYRPCLPALEGPAPSVRPPRPFGFRSSTCSVSSALCCWTTSSSRSCPHFPDYGDDRHDTGTATAPATEKHGARARLGPAGCLVLRDHHDQT